MARFPDLRISATRAVFPEPACKTAGSPVTFRGNGSRCRSVAALLAAYSGGTVWAFHPTSRGRRGERQIVHVRLPAGREGV